VGRVKPYGPAGGGTLAASTAMSSTGVVYAIVYRLRHRLRSRWNTAFGLAAFSAVVVGGW
jgi:hypothetical protein